MSTILQFATNGITPTLEVHTTTSMSLTFGSAVLPGSAIGLFVYLDGDNISYPAISSVVDNKGNTYTLGTSVSHTTNSGPGLAAYLASNAAAGATTITINFVFSALPFGAYTGTFTLMAVAVEATGLGTSTAVQDTDIVHNFGVYTSVLTISDSFSNSFTATINSPNNYNSWGFVDFSGNSDDLSFVFGGSPNNTADDTVVVSPGSSSTLIASVSLPSFGHLGLYSGALALSPSVRGNIDYDDVGLDARQGPTHGRKIVYSDGSYAVGRTPIFLDDGTLSNSDVAPGGGGSGVGSDLLTDLGDLLTFDGTADVRFARGADGYFLTSESGEPAGLLWVPNPNNLLNARGDLLGHNGTGAVRFGVGADGTYLIADSSQPQGFRWSSQAGTQPWDASINFIGKMTNAQAIPIASLRRATTIPANFSGSGGFVLGSNPAATVTMTVKKGGVTIGTVVVSTSGTFTFATTSGAVVNGALDDQLVLANQATADTTFDTFNITFAFLR